MCNSCFVLRRERSRDGEGTGDDGDIIHLNTY